MSVRKLDGFVWAKVETLLKQPEVILAELDKMKHGDDPVAQDIVMLDRRLHEEERRAANLARRIADLDDDSVAETLLNQLKVVNQAIHRLREERELVCAPKGRWEQALAGANRVEAWVEAMQDAVSDLSDEEKRLLLEALDIRVRVYRQGHEPRIIIDGAVPLDDIALIRGTCRRRCRC